MTLYYYGFTVAQARGIARGYGLQPVLALGAHCTVCHGRLNTAHWSHGLGHMVMMCSYWLLSGRNVFLVSNLHLNYYSEASRLAGQQPLDFVGKYWDRRL